MLYGLRQLLHTVVNYGGKNVNWRHPV